VVRSDVAARAARTDRGEDSSRRPENALDGVDRLFARLTSWPFVGLAVVVAVIALTVGSAIWTTTHAVLALVGVGLVLTLPLWLGVFLAEAVFLVAFFSLLAGLLWLVAAVPAWVGLLVALLLVPVLVGALRRPWTIEAVSWQTSPVAEFRGMWWKVHGYRQSKDALEEVTEALWRGTGETCRPAGAASGPKIVSVPGATRPPAVD
jgi:hypothetical protein